MSEDINNKEYRQKVLKELIGELHKGKTVEEVKSRFQEVIKDISPACCLPRLQIHSSATIFRMPATPVFSSKPGG